MSEQISENPGMELYYEDRLPLRCTVLDGAPDGARLARLQEESEEVLRVLSALDEHYPELTDEHPLVAHELQRFDFKLNLLLDLVSQVLTRHHPLPQPVPVKLGAQGLEWTAASPPPAAAWVELEIYLNPKYPSPLMLPAQVQDVRPAPGGALVTATFGALAESVQDWLGKTIFRHHRRQIALTRRRTGK